MAKQKQRHKRYVWGSAIFLVAGLFTLLIPLVTKAATPLWSAQELLRSHTGTISMSPGDSVEFIVGFKNTGQATWRSQDSRFISVYTHDPKYRNSIFADNSWMSVEQPTRLFDDSVAPGAIGRLKFILYAPMEPGLYHETFYLAAENTAWIPGGKFTITIDVDENNGTPTAGYRAIKLMTSAKELSLKAGTKETFRVAFKNIGRKVWKRASNPPLQLVAESGNAYSFRDSNWSGQVAATLPTNDVLPGQLSFFDISLKAPSFA